MKRPTILFSAATLTCLSLTPMIGPAGRMALAVSTTVGAAAITAPQVLPRATSAAIPTVRPAAPRHGRTIIAAPAAQPIALRSTAPASAPISPVHTVAPVPKASHQAAAQPSQVQATALDWANGQEAWLEIPSIGLRSRVFYGGQDVIDQGDVTHYVGGASWLPPVAAGARGTYWLAAHNGSHGSPFGSLPALTSGQNVYVVTRTHTFIYRTTNRVVVQSYVARSTVYGTDSNASRILLQTCLGDTRLLVSGVLVSVQ